MIWIIRRISVGMEATNLTPWHVQKELPITLKQPPRLLQNLRGIPHMLKRVMADHHLGQAITQCLGVRNKFNPSGAQPFGKKLGYIDADLSCGGEFGEIPAGPDADLHHGVLGFYGVDELGGTEARHPWVRGFGQGAFHLVVLPA